MGNMHRESHSDHGEEEANFRLKRSTSLIQKSGSLGPGDRPLLREALFVAPRPESGAGGRSVVDVGLARKWRGGN